MKQTRRMFSWLVAGSLALMMATSLTAGPTKERVGTVVRLKGSARYSTGNNVWLPIKTGTLLKSGNLVQTAADSYVDVVLGESDLTPPRAVAGESISYESKAEQDMIRVRQDSVLAFDKLTVTDTGSDEVTETQLDLRSGKIFGSVKKLSAGSHYEVKLPNGVAGVRGTTYSISADGVVQVLSGSMVISWIAADGTPMTQTVSAGYQFDTRTGLLTPIPENEHNEMVRVSLQSRVNRHHRHFNEDHTIYNVSPSQGDNNNQNSGGSEPGGRGVSDGGK